MTNNKKFCAITAAQRTSLLTKALVSGHDLFKFDAQEYAVEKCNHIDMNGDSTIEILPDKSSYCSVCRKTLKLPDVKSLCNKDLQDAANKVIELFEMAKFSITDGKEADYLANAIIALKRVSPMVDYVKSKDLQTAEPDIKYQEESEGIHLRPFPFKHDDKQYLPPHASPETFKDLFCAAFPNLIFPEAKPEKKEEEKPEEKKEEPKEYLHNRSSFGRISRFANGGNTVSNSNNIKEPVVKPEKKEEEKPEKKVKEELKTTKPKRVAKPKKAKIKAPISE